MFALNSDIISHILVSILYIPEASNFFYKAWHITTPRLYHCLSQHHVLIIAYHSTKFLSLLLVIQPQTLRAQQHSSDSVLRSFAATPHRYLNQSNIFHSYQRVWCSMQHIFLSISCCEIQSNICCSDGFHIREILCITLLRQTSEPLCYQFSDSRSEPLWQQFVVTLIVVHSHSDSSWELLTVIRSHTDSSSESVWQQFTVTLTVVQSHSDSSSESHWQLLRVTLTVVPSHTDSC